MILLVFGLGLFYWPGKIAYFFAVQRGFGLLVFGLGLFYWCVCVHKDLWDLWILQVIILPVIGVDVAHLGKIAYFFAVQRGFWLGIILLVCWAGCYAVFYSYYSVHKDLWDLWILQVIILQAKGLV